MSGSAAPVTPASAAARDAARLAAASQSTLDAIVASVRLGDRASFDEQMTKPSSAFADRLYADLGVLPSRELQLNALPETAALDAADAARYPGGWLQSVRIESRLDHDAGPARYQVWLLMTPAAGGTARLAGVADDLSGRPSERPLWLIEPVRMVTGPHATVLAGGSTALSGWLERSERAEKAVRTRLAASRRGDWLNGLVVEVPSTERAFEHVLGIERGSYHRIAAVAWPMGGDPAHDAVRIVVNPAAAGALDDDQLAVLLTHEATHVLTRSASSPAPMWLVEGFADWIAFDRLPQVAPPTEDLVLADVRRNGPPAAFPADADFRPDADQLELTYGRAWMLCRYIAASTSTDDLVRLYAAIDGGTPPAAALPDVLGVDEATLLTRWRGWLERQADR